jgi:ATP-dependent DNA helicase RecQ
VRLAVDYFSLGRDEFIRRWLPDQEKELNLQTTPQSWRAIVEDLNNPVQQRIVADDREQTNVLVLAGPGSGKTRALVHRIAYLLRVRRENSRGILALAYNRHAPVEIRRRLADLIGDDARGVTVLTCHALAMRLVGVSFAGIAAQVNGDQFTEVLRQAVALLKGEGLPPEEADEQRERLLAGFRWILVDEYQDVGPEQYELIAALAGRTLQDEEGRLSLFAVGDDDQNIYAFSGASVEFIRRFEADYTAKPSYLVENYRSTAHIIGAANLIIQSAANRMKVGHPITIDRARTKSPRGGDWQGIDPISQGRVQVLPAGGNAMTQAVAIMAEFQRLSALAPAWDWTQCAVIAREWRFLDPVRSFCELNGIPAEMAGEDTAYFWRLRETQALTDWLRTQPKKLVDTACIERWLEAQPHGPWWTLLREAVDVYGLETDGAELPTEHFLEWLVEWGREVRRRQTGLLLLTAHRAKGLEFDHVAVLDGGWGKTSQNEDPNAPRRLYYVAMTRARKTLTLARFDQGHALLDVVADDPSLLRRASTSLPPPAPELARYYRRLSMRDVDLGFAGRHAAKNSVHRAIAALSPNDHLHLHHRQERWELQDNKGTMVGRLAHAFTPPPGMRCVAARVMAIIVRRRDDAEPEYQSACRCERWELVLPELIFEPNNR